MSLKLNNNNNNNNIASIKLTCTRGLGHVGEFRYLIGLAASAAPRREFRTRVYPRGAARRGAIRARLCSQIVASTAPRRAATYCEPGLSAGLKS